MKWRSRWLPRLQVRREELTGYLADFPRTAEAFGRFLDAVDMDLGRVKRPGRVAVVVLPWVATPLPWYAVMLALALRRRGREVVILWDDSDLPMGAALASDQNREIAPIVARLQPVIPTLRLSDTRPARRQRRDREELARAAALNEQWHLRGAAPTPAAIGVRRATKAALAGTLARARRIFASHRFDYVVVPGGVWGSTGLWVYAARQHGTRVSTFDAGQGWVQSSNSGAAAQQTDIPDAFHTLWCEGDGARRPMVQAAQDEFAARVEARDRAGFQAARATRAAEGLRYDVLLPMNVDHDAAALGRHQHFRDALDWVGATIDCILAESALSVAIRQHPSERRDLERGSLDVAAHIRRRFGDDRRIRFVAADEPISTYDLLEHARLVLPLVSTFGIEAAAAGKPVLIAGSAYYGDLGFVYSASSRDDYMRLLRKGLSEQLPPLPDQVERAWLCYYLSQCCNRLWTEVTPQPADFWKWCPRAPGAVFDDPATADLLSSIDEDEPLALVRHRRLTS